jgi:hypothetical protein
MLTPQRILSHDLDTQDLHLLGSHRRRAQPVDPLVCTHAQKGLAQVSISRCGLAAVAVLGAAHAWNPPQLECTLRLVRIF